MDFETPSPSESTSTMGTVDEYGELSEEDCTVFPSPDKRWYFVAIAGTSLSIVSIVCNILIAFVLLKRKYAHFYFLGLLAASDTFLSICYGPVIAMDVIKSRLQILWLTRLYWSYLGPLLSLCHVSMTFSCLMIILGTIERFLITEKSPFLSCWRKRRRYLGISMMGLALILRGTEVFEYTLRKNGNCTGLTEYEPILTELTTDYLYGTLFRFYLRNILTVFLPFMLLAYLNICIVTTLRRQQRSATMFRFGSSEHKLKIRSATRLLVLIVCSYLVANVPNVIITAWEYIDFESTQTESLFEIYELLTDIISVLYVFVCATRLPFYLVCNQELRSAFYESLCIRSDGFKTIPQKIEFSGEQKISVSAQRSNLGTEFDRLAIAIAGSGLITPKVSNVSSPQNHVNGIMFTHSNGTNGFHQIEEPLIIENPLANFETKEKLHDDFD
ncbi:hypothetical protein FO519_007899 [Halicephalobus sp. NKZ332]|nr:hypothetical protein FO519_007899 [Halicephalobus sp. NKZ332]